ncbi:DUF2812 domain-containing protein [bacterium]|nr:DUF2812 domain-containing protein [candidate division CSSED10-310 bacterium]
MNRIRKIKWWWGWNVEKIERWLEQRERDGWNLVDIGSLGVSFVFHQGIPRRVAYRVDYQNQVKEDYLQLFQDAGWSLIGKSCGWYFWKQEYTVDKPEIFTDVESLIDRNRRQIWLIALIGLIQWPGIHSEVTRLLDESGFFISAMLGMQGLLSIVLAFALIRFLHANHRLRNQRILS